MSIENFPGKKTAKPENNYDELNSRLDKLRQESKLNPFKRFETKNGYSGTIKLNEEGSESIFLSDKDGNISTFVIADGILKLEDFEDFNQVFNKHHPLAAVHQEELQSSLDAGEILT